MILLTFVKYALTRFDPDSTHVDDLRSTLPTDTGTDAGFPPQGCLDHLTELSLNPDHRTIDPTHDELARFSLTTPAARPASHSDFERWM